MDQIALLLTNVLWVIVLVASVITRRQTALLEPLVWCGAAHLIFFSQPPQLIDGDVGWVHLLASAAVLVGYRLYSRRARRQRRLPARPRAGLPRTNTVPVIMLIACLVLTLAEKAMAWVQGIPLVDVLLGMRLMTGQAEMSGEAALVFVVAARCALVALMVGRVWLLISPSVSLAIAWWLLFASFLLSGFASGGRTAIALPVLGMLIADVYVYRVALQKAGGRVRFFRQVSYIMIGLVVAGAMMYQSAFRAVSVSSFSEAWANFQEQLAGGLEATALTSELKSGLNDTVAWVTRNYGHTVPYAYFYSPYAMLVNPLPRLYWSEKPVGWGRRVAWEILRQEPGSPGTSMAAGIGGEAYANGGYPAVLVYGLLFGVGFAVVRAGIWGATTPVAAGFWLSLLLWMFAFWRGDWLSSVNRMAYSLFSAWLIYRMARPFGSPKRMPRKPHLIRQSTRSLAPLRVPLSPRVIHSRR